MTKQITNNWEYTCYQQSRNMFTTVWWCLFMGYTSSDMLSVVLTFCFLIFFFFLQWFISQQVSFLCNIVTRHYILPYTRCVTSALVHCINCTNVFFKDVMNLPLHSFQLITGCSSFMIYIRYLNLKMWSLKQQVSCQSFTVNR